MTLRALIAISFLFLHSHGYAQQFKHELFNLEPTIVKASKGLHWSRVETSDGFVQEVTKLRTTGNKTEIVLSDKSMQVKHRFLLKPIKPIRNVFVDEIFVKNHQIFVIYQGADRKNLVQKVYLAVFSEQNLEVVKLNLLLAEVPLDSRTSYAAVRCIPTPDEKSFLMVHPGDYSSGRETSLVFLNSEFETDWEAKLSPIEFENTVYHVDNQGNVLVSSRTFPVKYSIPYNRYLPTGDPPKYYFRSLTNKGTNEREVQFSLSNDKISSFKISTGPNGQVLGAFLYFGHRDSANRILKLIRFDLATGAAKESKNIPVSSKFRTVKSSEDVGILHEKDQRIKEAMASAFSINTISWSDSGAFIQAEPTYHEGSLSAHTDNTYHEEFGDILLIHCSNDAEMKYFSVIPKSQNTRRISALHSSFLCYPFGSKAYLFYLERDDATLKKDGSKNYRLKIAEVDNGEVSIEEAWIIPKKQMIPNPRYAYIRNDGAIIMSFSDGSGSSVFRTFTPRRSR